MPLEISPLTVAWSMCASACLMLALMHVLLWLKERRSPVYILSTLMATAAAVNAVCELFLMSAQNVQTYASWLKVEVVGAFVLLVSLVWFVYLYFGTASKKLAVAITVMWSVCVVINILAPNSLVFTEITDFSSATTYWGETFSIAQGVRNPWNNLADLASVLILVYLAHASVLAWRKGDQQRAAVVGGASVLFIVLGGVHTPLVDAGLLRTPYMISFAFLAIVVAMSYELVSEAFLASRYAREIEAGERRWRTLVNTVPVFVAGLDREGRINFSNAMLRERSGYSEQELQGMHFTDFMPRDDFGRAKKVFRDALEGKVSAQERIAFVAKDGSRREVVWSNGVINDATGRATGVLSIGADVTDRARAQAELQRTRREMDRLTRATLLGEVAAGLAHELNQPLTAILSNAQAARRMLSSASPNLTEVRSIVEDIIADDKRASNVVHGLRAFLRRGEHGHRQVELNKVIHDVAELLSGELRAQQIDLGLELADDLLPVRADEVQLQQVVMNLLLNAMKAVSANASGERRLVVKTQAKENSVTVTVIDRGPGIAAELLPKLFDPFVTTGSDGLGMGLAICRRIIEFHGGHITAANDPGGGAEFSFSLPLHADVVRA